MHRAARRSAPYVGRMTATGRGRRSSARARSQQTVSTLIHDPPRSTGRVVTIPVRSRGMKIGVMLAGVNTKFWTAAAQAAEDAGFESVWLPEHLVFPVEMQGSPHDGRLAPADPVEHARRSTRSMALAAIAATTKNVRLGTNVYKSACAIRSSPCAARPSTSISATVASSSGSARSWLRRGVGRRRPRLLHAGAHGSRRASSILRRLWSEDVVEHHGEFFDFDAGDVQPEAGAATAAEPAHRWRRRGGQASRRARGRRLGAGGHCRSAAAPGALARSTAALGGRTRARVHAHRRVGASSPWHDVDRPTPQRNIDRVCVRPFMTYDRDTLDGIGRFSDEVIAGSTP